MSETTTDPELKSRTPEHQATVKRLEGLADMAAAWAEENGAAVTRTENADGVPVESHDGIGVNDVEDMLVGLNPQDTPEQSAVRAARLFNRIVMEEHGIPAPDDLSRMDTTSLDARVRPSVVIQYAASHLVHRLELTNPADQDEFNKTVDGAVARSMAALGYDADSPDVARAQQDVQDRARRSLHPATGDYKMLPEY